MTYLQSVQFLLILRGWKLSSPSIIHSAQKAKEKISIVFTVLKNMWRKENAVPRQDRVAEIN